MILLAEDIWYIDNETVINLIKKCDEIGKMITWLQKTLN
jgi:hypothetical protein